MVVPDEGLVAEAVGVADVVGREDDDCVLGLVRAGVAEGDAADEAGGTALAGAAPGSAQLGGVAGTVGMVLAGLAAERVVGSGEDCAAGESDPPDVMAGRLPGSAMAFPGCPVSSLTAA